MAPQGSATIRPDRGNRLGVRLYPYEDLPTIAEERGFFAVDNAHGFALSEVDLTGGADATVQNVGESLGAQDGPPIHHFVCHFFLEDEKSDEPERLHLGSDMHCPKVPLDRILPYDPNAERDCWIAFLNACHGGSAALFKTRWFFLLRNESPVALGLFYIYFAARPIKLDGTVSHVFL